VTFTNAQGATDVISVDARPLAMAPEDMLKHLFVDFGSFSPSFLKFDKTGIYLPILEVARDRSIIDIAKEITWCTAPRGVRWRLYFDENGYLVFTEGAMDGPPVKVLTDERDILRVAPEFGSRDIKNVVRATARAANDQQLTAIAYDVQSISTFGQKPTYDIPTQLLATVGGMDPGSGINYMNGLVNAAIFELSMPSITVEVDILPDYTLQVGDPVAVIEKKTGLGGNGLINKNVVSNSETYTSWTNFNFTLISGAGPGGSSAMVLNGTGNPLSAAATVRTNVPVVAGQTYVFSQFVDPTWSLSQENATVVGIDSIGLDWASSTTVNTKNLLPQVDSLDAAVWTPKGSSGGLGSGGPNGVTDYEIPGTGSPSGFLFLQSAPINVTPGHTYALSSWADASQVTSGAPKAILMDVAVSREIISKAITAGSGPGRYATAAWTCPINLAPHSDDLVGWPNGNMTLGTGGPAGATDAEIVGTGSSQNTVVCSYGIPVTMGSAYVPSFWIDPSQVIGGATQPFIYAVDITGFGSLGTNVNVTAGSAANRYTGPVVTIPVNKCPEPYSTWTLTGSASASTISGNWGSTYQRLSFTTASDSATSPLIAVTAGQQICLSAQITGTITAGSVTITAVDQNGATIPGLALSQSTGSNNRIRQQGFSIPAGVTGIKLIASANGATFTGTVNVQTIQLTFAATDSGGGYVSAQNPYVSFGVEIVNPIITSGQKFKVSQPMFEQSSSASGYYISSQNPTVRVILDSYNCTIANGQVLKFAQPQLEAGAVATSYVSPAQAGRYASPAVTIPVNLAPNASSFNWPDVNTSGTSKFVSGTGGPNGATDWEYTGTGSNLANNLYIDSGPINVTMGQTYVASMWVDPSQIAQGTFGFNLFDINNQASSIPDGTAGAVISIGNGAAKRYATPAWTCPTNLAPHSDDLGTGWNITAPWTVTSDGLNGVKSFTIVGTGSAVGATDSANYHNIACQANTNYTLSFWIDPSHITSGTVAVRIWDGTGTTLLATTQVSSGTAKRYSVTANSGSNTSLLIDVTATSTLVVASGQKLIASQPMLEAKSSASGYYISSQNPQIKMYVFIWNGQSGGFIVNNGQKLKFSQPMFEQASTASPLWVDGSNPQITVYGQQVAWAGGAVASGKQLKFAQPQLEAAYAATSYVPSNGLITGPVWKNFYIQQITNEVTGPQAKQTLRLTEVKFVQDYMYGIQAAIGTPLPANPLAVNTQSGMVQQVTLQNGSNTAVTVVSNGQPVLDNSLNPVVFNWNGGTLNIGITLATPPSGAQYYVWRWMYIAEDAYAMVSGTPTLATGDGSAAKVWASGQGLAAAIQSFFGTNASYTAPYDATANTDSTRARRFYWPLLRCSDWVTNDGVTAYGATTLSSSWTGGVGATNSPVYGSLRVGLTDAVGNTSAGFKGVQLYAAGSPGATNIGSSSTVKYGVDFGLSTSTTLFAGIKRKVTPCVLGILVANTAGGVQFKRIPFFLSI
jgi:hypothetical protein